MATVPPRLTPRLSPRLARIVDALPLTPSSRVLEIGCGPGAAARAVARRLESGHVLAIDRSATAIEQAHRASAAELASGRLRLECVAVEDFRSAESFDLVFAVRVGALDGRHPGAGRKAFERLAAVLAPGGRVFVDASGEGDPLREITLP